MYVCVWSGVWGVDGGWMPLPIRPQRHWDPASIVDYQKHMDICNFTFEDGDESCSLTHAAGHIPVEGGLAQIGVPIGR